MAKNDGTITVPFILEKETPGTYRFAEVGEKETHKIGTIYVKKATIAALGGNVRGLSVTLRAVG